MHRAKTAVRKSGTKILGVFRVKNLLNFFGHSGESLGQPPIPKNEGSPPSKSVAVASIWAQGNVVIVAKFVPLTDISVCGTFSELLVGLSSLVT